MPDMFDGVKLFRRVVVDNMIIGTTRVWWQLDPRFNPPGACYFQLQYSPTGTPTAADWENVGPPAENTYYAVDDTRRLTGKTLNAFYRVAITTGGETYISEPANCFGELDDHDWLLVSEILRKEELRNRNFAACGGHLLKRMRYGAKCPRCRDQLTDETTDGHCSVCNGTGYRIGFHPSVPLCVVKTNETIAETVDPETRGPINDEMIQGRVTAYPMLQKSDIWVEGGTDRRWIVDKVTVAAARRTMPVVLEVTLLLLPFTHPAYKFPLCGGVDTDDDAPDNGDGCTAINHNFGSADALRYMTTDGELPVAGARVAAYLKTVYDANSGRPPVTLAAATTTTGDDGRWVQNLHLNPGTYVIVFTADGFGPDAATIVVTRTNGYSSSSLSVD